MANIYQDQGRARLNLTRAEIDLVYSMAELARLIRRVNQCELYRAELDIAAQKMIAAADVLLGAR